MYLLIYPSYIVCFYFCFVFSYVYVIVLLIEKGSQMLIPLPDLRLH